MSKMSSWKLYVGNGWVRDNLKTLILLWVWIKKEFLLIFICSKNRNVRKSKRHWAKNDKALKAWMSYYGIGSLKMFMIGLKD
jgi:hypothetical protein